MLIANILGPFIFLYIYWTRLREDYLAERIFSSGFTVIFSSLVGILISKYFLPSYWFWFVMLLVLILESLYIFKLKMKFNEILDALVVSLLPWLSIYCLSDSISNSSLSSFLYFWFLLFLLFLFFLFNNFYRTFTWYKSGKVGFSGLVVLIIFFGVRAVASYFFPTTVSFSGNFEAYISASFFVISFLLLFKLARDYK